MILCFFLLDQGDDKENIRERYTVPIYYFPPSFPDIP